MTSTKRVGETDKGREGGRKINFSRVPRTESREEGRQSE